MGGIRFLLTVKMEDQSSRVSKLWTCTSKPLDNVQSLLVVVILSHALAWFEYELLLDIAQSAMLASCTNTFTRLRNGQSECGKDEDKPCYLMK